MCTEVLFMRLLAKHMINASVHHFRAHVPYYI